MYVAYCAGCHGPNGQGMTPLAPPLAGSEWVEGDEGRLIRIVLHGVEGAISVAGKSYAPPHVLPNMPGVASLQDSHIASILTFVRRAWGHAAEPVTPTRVQSLRRELLERKIPWTESELLNLSN